MTLINAPKCTLDPISIQLSLPYSYCMLLKLAYRMPLPLPLPQAKAYHESYNTEVTLFLFPPLLAAREHTSATKQKIRTKKDVCSLK